MLNLEEKEHQIHGFLRDVIVFFHVRVAYLNDVVMIFRFSWPFFYTLAVTKDGALWTFGMGKQGELGHNDRNNRLVPTRVGAQHFGNVNVISAAGAYYHPAAVIEEDTLFTWGRGDKSKGLGHASGMPMCVPTRVDPGLMGGARIGPCHKLQPIRALAFAMGMHSRLGGHNNQTDAVVGDGSQKRTQRQSDKTADNELERGCVYVTMPGDLIQRVI